MDINMTTYTRGGRYQWIESLRGFAAILVFLSHCPIAWVFKLDFVIGRVGVVLFFMMSGFLTVTAREKRNAKQYIFNRLLRIYPMYWILLCLKYFVDWKFSIPKALANFTAFQEYLGFDNTLGASWMLSIQTVFFIAVGIFGGKYFEWKNEKKRLFVMIFLSVCSIAVSLLRRVTGKPFPTAILLLLMVAFLGIVTYEYTERKITTKREYSNLVTLFGIAMFISVALSYPESIISYILAYGVGICLFWLFYTHNITQKELKHLGEIGYVFFLGAQIPYDFMTRYIDFEGGFFMRLLGCVLYFITSLTLAIVMTKYVEKTLLRFGKKIEENLN